MKQLFEQLLNSLKEQKVISEAKSTDLLKSFEEQLSVFKESIYDDAMNAVDDEHATEAEETFEKMDASYADKLKELVELIDATHKHQMEELLAMVDTFVTDKLQDVKDGYEEKISDIEEKKVGELEESISKYLDTYLEEVSPKAKLVSESKLEKLESTINELKKILFINEDYIKDEVKEAILEAKSIIDAKDKEVNKLMLEKVQIKSELNKIEAKQLLESKISKCSPKLSAFLTTFFKDAKKEDIEGRFDEAVKAFKADETVTREKLISESKATVNPKVVKIEDAKDDKTAITQPKTIMESYATIINKNKIIKG